MVQPFTKNENKNPPIANQNEKVNNAFVPFVYLV